MSGPIDNRLKFEYWATRLGLGLMIVGTAIFEFARNNTYLEIGLLSLGTAIAICTASWIQFHNRSDDVLSDSLSSRISRGLVLTAVIAPYFVSFWLPAVDISGFNTEEPPESLAGWEALLTLISLASGVFPSGLIFGIFALANPCFMMAIWSFCQRRFALATFWSAIATILGIAVGIIYRRIIEFGYLWWFGCILAMLLIALIASLWQMVRCSEARESPR